MSNHLIHKTLTDILESGFIVSNFLRRVEIHNNLCSQPGWHIEMELHNGWQRALFPCHWS